MGSFLTRAFIMILGYAYPAYECYKTVERNKPEIEQLLFWCRYWILVALLTVFERFGDAFVSWLPMYSEAKLAFIVYLWYPKTKGTTYVYNTFFRPYLAKHETEIDRGLSELRTRAGDMAILYWQKALTYGQTRFFEILQYVALQSYSISRPAKQAPLASASHQSAGSPKQHLKPAPSSPTQILSDTTLTEAKATQGNVAGASVIQESNSPPPLETVTEVVRARSGRLRNRAASSGKADAIQVNVVHTLGTQDSNPPPPPPPPEMGKKAGVPVRGGKLRNRVASNSGK